jgi:hypothetical protein
MLGVIMPSAIRHHPYIYSLAEKIYKDKQPLYLYFKECFIILPLGKIKLSFNFLLLFNNNMIHEKLKVV